MSRVSEMKSFHSPDGTCWGVQAELAGSSNALISPITQTVERQRKDRYAWINWRGPEASNVQATIDLDAVRATLTDALLAVVVQTVGVDWERMRGSGFLPGVICRSRTVRPSPRMHADERGRCIGNVLPLSSVSLEMLHLDLHSISCYHQYF